ncbi:MAG: magnesium transporter, partial [Halolamina sp.]
MESQTADTQQAIATASSPAAVFRDLSRADRRELFFLLPERVREQLVADLNQDQLRSFVQRLDSDEATDVLG